MRVKAPSPVWWQHRNQFDGNCRDTQLDEEVHKLSHRCRLRRRKLRKAQYKINYKDIEGVRRFDNSTSVRGAMGTESRGHRFEFCRVDQICLHVGTILVFNNYSNSVGLFHNSAITLFICYCSKTNLIRSTDISCVSKRYS